MKDSTEASVPTGFALIQRKIRSSPVFLAHQIRERPKILEMVQRAPAPVQRMFARLELRPTLVPMEKLEATYAAVLDCLGVPADGSPLVYLEFGVSQGSSMLCMYRATERVCPTRPPRLVGFDSFEGLPPETVTVEEQGGDAWRPGDFASRQSWTESYLRAHGVPQGRVELVKGWFSESLTSETRDRLHLSSVNVIMIDCDIYTAALEALNFCRDLIGSYAIVVFDDWGDENTPPNVGEEKAFNEFLVANPELIATELPELKFHACSRVFEVVSAMSTSGLQ